METTTKASGPLSYQIIVKPPYLVISFTGALSRESDGVLEKCWEEVLSQHAQFVVMNMQDTSVVERQFVAAFVKFQKRIRDKGASLRICEMDAPLYKELVERGAVRHAELSDTLAEALKSLLMESGQIKVA